MSQGANSDKSSRMRVLGVPVDRVDMRQAINRLEEMLDQPGLSHIVTPNPEIIVNAGKDPVLRNIIEKAELVVPDGIGLVYASKILGWPLHERVTGIDFLNMALSVLEQRGKSIYLLGSRPGADGEAGTAEKAAKAMQKAFPGLKVAGTYHGYFGAEEEAAIVDEINRSGADFLCVALGAPKQEKFISRHRNELKVSVAIGVGGSLDVYAGNVKRAPAFYREHGLEWLYRLKQEPSRYRRMLALPAFMLKVLGSRVGGKM